MCVRLFSRALVRPCAPVCLCLWVCLYLCLCLCPEEQVSVARVDEDLRDLYNGNSDLRTAAKTAGDALFTLAKLANNHSLLGGAGVLLYD